MTCHLHIFWKMCKSVAKWWQEGIIFVAFMFFHSLYYWLLIYTKHHRGSGTNRNTISTTSSLWWTKWMWRSWMWHDVNVSVFGIQICSYCLLTEKGSWKSLHSLIYSGNLISLMLCKILARFTVIEGSIIFSDCPPYIRKVLYCTQWRAVIVDYFDWIIWRFFVDLWLVLLLQHLITVSL